MANPLSLAELSRIVSGIDRVHIIDQLQDELRFGAQYLAFERRLAIVQAVAAYKKGGVNRVAKELGVGRDKISAALREHRESVLASDITIRDGHDITVHKPIGRRYPLACSCGWTGRMGTSGVLPESGEEWIRWRSDVGTFALFEHFPRPSKLHLPADVARRYDISYEDVLRLLAEGRIVAPSGEVRINLHHTVPIDRVPAWTNEDLQNVI